MSARVRPFSNGSQYDTWEAANCDRCVKNWRDDADGNPQTACEIAHALLVAFWDDGTIAAEIADRMGYESDRSCWQCGEVEWTEAWKQEAMRRWPERFGQERLPV